MKNLLKVAILISLCIISLRAQQDSLITIRGRVLDKETGAPIEDVNVFLSNTTIGTTTGKYGNFIISNIPYGSYKIVFSYIGYKTEINNLSSYIQKIFDVNISLEQKAINLNQVNVTGVVSSDWKNNLKTFTKAFIGDTKNSDKTKILNPEVLDFVKDKKTSILNASSDSTLVVENKALGYILYIVLNSFELGPKGDKNFIKYKCYTRFKELNPISEKQKLKWENNRKLTYIDSQRHFFYALVHKQLERDYYSLHEGPIDNLLEGKGTTILPKQLNLISDNDSTIFTFNFSGGLEVRRFLNEPSFLNFLYPFITIDRNGNLITSFYAVETYGYWSKNRIADLLPQNYIYTGQ